MSTVGSEFTFFLLGPEGSGKTTLLAQLRSLLEYQSLLPTDELVVAPTTGQEYDRLRLPSRSTIEGWCKGEVSEAQQDHTEAGQTRKQMLLQQSTGKDDTQDASLQGVGPSHMQGGRSHDAFVVVREVGGRMVSTWSKFIASASTSRGSDSSQWVDSRALMYVVDATSLWQMPQAAIEFASILLTTPASQWSSKALIVVNKYAFPCTNKLSLTDVSSMFLDSLSDEWRVRVDIVIADTWQGLGLLDILQWMQNEAEATNDI